MPTVDELVRAYVILRDSRDTLRKKQADEMAIVKGKMDKLEEVLHSALLMQDADAIKTKHGTVFITVQTSAKVQDWDSTLQFVKDEGLWHLLEQSVSKTAISEMAEAGQTVPGVELSRRQVVQVRRK